MVSTGDDEEGSPDPDHRHHHHHHHRVHTQDLSRIEGTVQGGTLLPGRAIRDRVCLALTCVVPRPDMQSRMDAMQADMSTLVAFAQTREPRCV